MGSPDFILHNALVLGTEVPGPSPTTVAVTGSRISAVGHDEILAAATTETETIDLQGRTLVPGINDGHLHVGLYSQTRPPAALDVTPLQCPTVRSIADLIAGRVAELEPGQWIRGRGWVGASLQDLDGTEPSAKLIDHVSPHNPVVLTDFSGHAIWVNSAAMNAAGLTSTTPVPATGLARRTADGDFTGLFVDAAQELIGKHIPTPTDAELEASVRAALAELHRNGITSITDAALNPLPGSKNSFGGHRVYDLLRRICHRDDVAMRTNVLMTFSSAGSTLLDDTRLGLDQVTAAEADPSWFAVRGLKIFADGVPPSCTAWMSTAYPDGSHGCLTVGGDTDADRVDELHEIIRTGHDHGLQIGVHATGDLTTEAVVEGFATAMSNNQRPDPRHYIIHGPLAPPQLIARAGELGLGFNVQPSLKSTSARSIEGLFGRELSEWQWPLRAMIDSGSHLAASSDAPICEPNWRRGIAGAVLRETADGEVYGEGQRIRVEEALHAYTAAGAWQDKAESWKGSIDVGKVADLCVVDTRLTTDDPRSFADSPVSLTMVDGTIVYQASE